jgi:uncharacterized protein (DUF2461 family)
MGMESKNPEPLRTTRGWHHTPTAEAAGARRVAALSVRPSAPETEGPAMDDARKQRGMVIATQQQIRRTPKGYLVPSQSGQGKYAVIVDGDKATCTCPDYELRAEPCKHVFAVRIVIQREFDFANGTVTETVSITKTVRRT